MAETLRGKTIAVLVTSGFEELDFIQPRDAFVAAGAKVVIVSPEDANVMSWRDDKWSAKFAVGQQLFPAVGPNFDGFHGLHLPGGMLNADQLRVDATAVFFVNRFRQAGKPIVALNQAGWVLASADALRGRRVNFQPSLRTDSINAGAEWSETGPVSDRRLVTSGTGVDHNAFSQAAIAAFAA